jgi:hypothetical protein
MAEQCLAIFRGNTVYAQTTPERMTQAVDAN